MVVVLPQPPLLVPELATGAAAETADLRAACRAAAARMGAAGSEWVAVGADAGGRRTVPADTRGSFVGFGADVVVGLSPDATGPVDAGLPLPLLVAGWAAAGTGARIRGELVAPDTTPADCAALGAGLAEGPVGLLVVGDGSAKHTLKAPGHLDERSGPFDDAVASALRDADPAGLAALDPELARELWAIGRAPWQVLAGATTGQDWTGELLYSGAPYGVGYHVAVWTR
jgi:hypothetical protein